MQPQCASESLHLPDSPVASLSGTDAPSQVLQDHSSTCEQSESVPRRDLGVFSCCTPGSLRQPTCPTCPGEGHYIRPMPWISSAEVEEPKDLPDPRGPGSAEELWAGKTASMICFCCEAQDSGTPGQRGSNLQGLRRFLLLRQRWCHVYFKHFQATWCNVMNLVTCTVHMVSRSFTSFTETMGSSLRMQILGQPMEWHEFCRQSKTFGTVVWHGTFFSS